MPRNVRGRLHRLEAGREKRPADPGTIVLLGTWDRDTDGNFQAGPDGEIYECWPDGRKRIAREVPAGDFKLVLGMNPFSLV